MDQLSGIFEALKQTRGRGPLNEGRDLKKRVASIRDRRKRDSGEKKCSPALVRSRQEIS